MNTESLIYFDRLGRGRLFCGKEGEQLANLFFAGCASVFGDFKGLGVLNALGLRPVEPLQGVAPLGLDAADGDGPLREPCLAKGYGSGASLPGFVGGEE